MEEKHPLAFTNKKLCDRNMGKSTYEKEMFYILHAVYMWHPYLTWICFYIKTNHHNLKYILEQGLSSLKYQNWVTKMLVYDYEIIYKKGKENVVVNVVCRKYEENGSLFSLSFLVLD
jgi:hypothetical protein